MTTTLVLGGPGSGKTTRLLSAIEAALARGVPPGRLAFVAFTNAAADEARERACKRFNLEPKELPYFRTLHSLCFRELGLRRTDIVTEEHLRELGDLTGELFTGDSTTEGPAAGLNADPLLTLDHYARATRSSLRRAWEDHGGEIDWFRLLRFTTAYHQYKRDRDLLDFTDLLDHYVSSDMRPIGLEEAVIDEGQDFTMLQWAVADRAFANVPHLWIGGDDDQCQPGGTSVLTDRGAKNLADIKPGVDRLVAYARSDGLVGFRNGFHFKKTKRRYVGNLMDVHANDKASSCTPNHKWLVRWNDEARDQRLCCVYIMRRGRNFRVGWCQLFKIDETLHLNSRARLEKADAVWMLKVCDVRSDAYAYEQIINARYGIPMVPFEARGSRDGDLVKRSSIAKIYSEVSGGEGALQALKDHGLLVDHPLIDRSDAKNYSRYNNVIITVVAANLVPNIMSIPVYDEKRMPLWCPISRIETKKADTFVFSLDVDKHHTYVADGLITHNSIHSWAGAAEEHFLDLPYAREVLPLSHRLPSTIFDLSQEVIRRVGRRFAKPSQAGRKGGSIEWVGSPDEINLSTGTWLLLARTRAQLTQLVELARTQGVVYRHKTAVSVDPKHVLAISAHEKLRAGGRVEGPDVLAALKAAGVRREVDEGWSYTAAELEYDASPIWHDALVRIPLGDREYYLACMRRGEKLTRVPRVRIETIHGAKGAEAENTLLITDLTYRTQRGYELEPDSEIRVFYVGLTRASERLILVSPQSAYGFAI